MSAGAAQYSVIRYIGDPARNEPLNVGIIVWTSEGFATEVDEAAVGRVIRENPHLEKDALMYLDGDIRQRLKRTVPQFDDSGFLRIIAEQSGFPVLLSEPRATTVSGSGETAMRETLERLLTRIVRPHRRRGGTSGLPTASALQRELKPLIEQKRIAHKHVVRAKSGVPRVIDFFANSGSNVGLDVVNFALASGTDVRNRADQEAFKVWDLLNSEEVSDYYVLGVYGDDQTRDDKSATVTNIISSTGAKLAQSVEEAREILASAASKTPSTDHLFSEEDW